MRIAVIDVAADKGGALSVLNDFVDTLLAQKEKTEDEWYIFTSTVKIKEAQNIRNIQFPETKKSWFHRLYWEYFVLPRLVKKYDIGMILSLQNNALPIRKIKQTVFLHNVLMVQRGIRFSFLRKEERKFAVYTRILAPYIRYTWKRASQIIVQGEGVKQQTAYYFPADRIVVRKPETDMAGIPKNHGKIKGYIYPATPYLYKNYEVIIEAVKLLESRSDHLDNFEILFTITGEENDYAGRIKTLASGTRSIKCIGYLPREELLTYYQDYGLLISSRLESFCVPIQEAMYAETVILGINLPYVLEHCKTGYRRMYLFENNPEDLGLAIEKGLSDNKEALK